MSRVPDRWEDSSGGLRRGFLKYEAGLGPMWDLVLDYARPSLVWYFFYQDEMLRGQQIG